MRLMERIRTRFRVFFLFFIIIFVVSTFGGLGIGFITMPRNIPTQGETSTYRSLVPGVLAVAEIGGKSIDGAYFYDRLYEISALMEQRGRPRKSDPIDNLEKMNVVLDYLFREQTLLRYANENGITVSEAEIEAEVNKLIESTIGGKTEKEPEKSLVSEIQKRIKASAERRKALADYLERSNLTRSQLNERIRLEQLAKKAEEAIDEVEKEKGEKKAQEKLEKIKSALKAGQSFAEVAKQYSEDESTKDKGGLLDFMMPRNFMDPAVADTAFKLKVGEYSEPIKQEFGYELIQVVEKKEAVGKDFEKAKPDIIKKLMERNKATKDYKPTDEEIKNEYEQVKIRHIIVRNPYQVEGTKRLFWLIQTQKKVIYDPLLLAYKLYKKEPPFLPELKEKTLEQISAQVKGVDKKSLSRLRDFLKKNEEDYWKRQTNMYGFPPDDLLPKVKETGIPLPEKPADEVDKSAKDSSRSQDATNKKTSSEDDKKKEEKAEVPLVVPYPLVIGLFLEAIKLNSKVAQNYYYAAYMYEQWLSDSFARTYFPVDVDTARAEIERLLKEAIDLYEFEPHYYALLGVNYAGWVKAEQAREQLKLALKYGGKDEEVLSKVYSGYIENGDMDEAKEVDKVLAEIRAQKATQRGTNIPIQIPSR